MAYRDLRQGRPDPPDDHRGLDCMRCGEETEADRLRCLYGNYWLCRKCAKFHIGIQRAAGKI